MVRIKTIDPEWTAPPNVRAFTTTRHHGFSRGQWSSLNLGGNCGDNPVHVNKNRNLLRNLLPCAPRWLRQVHSNRVVAWHESEQPEEDAVTSFQAGQVCAVLTADCLPVLFCDKAGTKVAAAHAGWRGLAAGVLEATVFALACNADDLIAWMGPAIGPQAFEVGSEVRDLFVDLNPENDLAFKIHGDRWLADIYKLGRLALSRSGIRQVSGGQHCTYSEAEQFFSYRREGQTGRFASVIWLDD
jgi:YfiH family protein